MLGSWHGSDILAGRHDLQPPYRGRIQGFSATASARGAASVAAGKADKVGRPASTAEPIRPRPAESADPNETGTLMHYTNGWMGGGMWVWTVIGVLVVGLLAVVIGKQFRQ